MEDQCELQHEAPPAAAAAAVPAAPAVPPAAPAAPAAPPAPAAVHVPKGRVPTRPRRKADRMPVPKIRQIVCGGSHHTMVLNDANQLYAFGDNEEGQLGLGDNDDRNVATLVGGIGGGIRQIVCGGYHTMVLNDKNQLYAFGLNNRGQLGLGHNNRRNVPTQLILN